MSYKLAFASSDGKFVNQCFIRTEKFLIYKIRNNNVEYLETRDNEPHFQGYEDHKENIKKLINLISDCRAIFVANIGYVDLVALKVKGIQAFEEPRYINDIIKRILSSSLKI